jgi:hypothetical protein
LGQTPDVLWPAYKRAICNHEAGYKSIAKYDKAQPVLNLSSWALAGDWTIRHFAPYLSNSRVVDWDFVTVEMDKQTSPGYPWNLIDRSKSHMLDREFFKQYRDLFWDRLATGNRAPVIWCNNVKEELRSSEKIAENKLRTFTGAPLEHVMATMRLCWDMNNSFYLSNNKTWSFVGGSKFRRGWDNLFKRLNKHPNAFELDESAYDSSLFREAMYGMIDFRWSMYSPKERTVENRKRLEALYVEIVDSIIVCTNGDVVTKNTGNPSGSANTIVDNTVILFRLMAYAWIELWNREKPFLTPSYSDFVSNVEAALNGDDNTWTCSNDVVSWYNSRSVSDVWSGIGVITHADSYDAQKLASCSFLSMAFKLFQNVYVPVPEQEKVYCALAYSGHSNRSVRFSLLRAYALRIESYFDPDARVFIAEYIKWLLSTYNDLLHAPSAAKGLDFSFEDVQSVYRTDSEIQALFLGSESESSKPRVEAIDLRFFR